MKKYKIFLGMILMAFTFNSSAQEPKFIVKLNTAALADLINFPSIQVGLENKINRRITMYNEAGIQYMLSSLEPPNVTINKNYGYKYRLEFRNYFNNKNPDSVTLLKGYYIGVNVQASVYSYNATGYYRPIADTTQELTDDYGVKKTVFTPNLVLGKQIIAGKRFVFDIFTGIGVRFRNLQFTDQDFDKQNDQFEYPSRHFTVAGGRHAIETGKPGTVLLNLQAGIRIGYAFGY